MRGLLRTTSGLIITAALQLGCDAPGADEPGGFVTAHIVAIDEQGHATTVDQTLTAADYHALVAEKETRGRRQAAAEKEGSTSAEVSALVIGQSSSCVRGSCFCTTDDYWLYDKPNGWNSNPKEIICLRGRGHDDLRLWTNVFTGRLWSSDGWSFWNGKYYTDSFHSYFESVGGARVYYSQHVTTGAFAQKSMSEPVYAVTQGNGTFKSHFTSNPPEGRWQHRAASDEGNDRMMMYGGKTWTTDYDSNFWVLTNATATGPGGARWTRLAPSGTAPPGRHMSSLIYDPGSNRATIFAGHTAPGFTNDVWVLTNANGLGGTPMWIQLAPTGTKPALREWHTAVYRQTSNTMIVYSGTAGNDLWALSHANGLGGTPEWKKLAQNGGGPGVRIGHTAVYAGSNRMIVFGGTEGTDFNLNYRNDTWVLEHADGTDGVPTWTKLAPAGTAPPPRMDHVAVYNPNRNRMTIFGGWTGPDSQAVFFRDLWVLRNANGASGTPQWVRYNPVDNFGPLSVELPVAVLNVAKDQMAVMGGKEDHRGIGGDPEFLSYFTHVLTQATGEH